MVSLQVKLVGDSRPFYHRVVESFLNKFFPSGYPYRSFGLFMNILYAMGSCL